VTQHFRKLPLTKAQRTENGRKRLALGISFAQYVEMFRANGVDVELLGRLTKDIGVASLGHPAQASGKHGRMDH
jgi:hypothetical protein